jgi:guanylate kinase
MSKSGLLVVISGPSGVGKSTITRALVERLNARFSISMTTRAKTTGETDGVDYHFVDEARFRQAIDNDELLEHAQVFGNWYGTPRKPIDEAVARGELIVLEIDVEGAIQVRERCPQAFEIFILPPSEEVLLQRLRDRKREGEEAIQKRFAEAQREMVRARESGAYDAFVVNDDLETAIREVIGLVEKRRHGG